MELTQKIKTSYKTYKATFLKLEITSGNQSRYTMMDDSATGGWKLIRCFFLPRGFAHSMLIDNVTTSYTV